MRTKKSGTEARAAFKSASLKTNASRLRPLELEDLPGFPQSLRIYQTDFLGALSCLINLYEPLQNLIPKTAKKIVDLASGSGIPAKILTADLRATGAILILSDKFPRKQFKQENGIRYHPLSVDFTLESLPDAELYLMFNSIHHFEVEVLEKRLEEIGKAGAGAIFTDPISPDLSSFLKVLFSTALLPIFLVPFIKPFRWDRLIYTYLLPIGIITTVWDGLASVLKSYDQKIYLEIENRLRAKGYNIRSGRLKGRFAKLNYLQLIS